MKQNHIYNLSIVAFSLFCLSSCGFVEMSGKMTRVTGEVMEDYSKENEGFIGKMAGFGGKINTAVGTTVENMAHKGETSNPEKSKTGQLTEAKTEVLNSAIDSVKEKGTTEKNIVLHAQTQLQSLGYDPGPADGIMGNKTRLAIGNYQQSKNLKITYSLDKRTLSALNLNSIE